MNPFYIVDAACTIKHSSPENDRADRSALLVIDMQEDFLSPRGRLPVEPAAVSSLVESVNHAIAEAAAGGIPVIHIVNRFPAARLSNLFRNFAAIEGSAGAAIDERVSVGTAPVLSKRRGDAFSNPALGALLTRQGVNRVILAGVHANGCVLATARGALRRGYVAGVLSGCVASRSRRATQRALGKMERIGVSIT